MSSSTSSSKVASRTAEYRKLGSMLLFFVLLFCFLLLLEVTMQHGIKQNRKGEVGKVNGIISHELDADVAVFGSSVALVHFDPAIISNITGLECYNFGLNGTTLPQYHGVLSEYLSYAKADIIVLAGTASELAARNQLYEVYKFRHHLDNELIYNSLYALDPALTWRLKYAPFYSFSIYNKAYYQAALQGLLGKAQTVEEQKGFSPEHRTWKAQARLQQGRIPEEIDTASIALYAQKIREINAKGKKAVLVLTPIFVEGQHRMAFLPKLRVIYRQLAGEENYFFDFTRSTICQNPELFYNNTHLNYKGAALFSEEFARQLNAVVL
ncbi:hypothetical protein [Botryobacter ruber]|uniref:hypothetical protein n=1 Tax=Botryobacter ruber TaxID=2171629 RepID=UPI000F64EB1F|nr:hypothetical protein [Botryobacter ruber]